MIYMWFTGINWPLRKIASLFLRPYGNQVVQGIPGLRTCPPNMRTSNSIVLFALRGRGFGDNLN
jgi:hypothetical protein